MGHFSRDIGAEWETAVANKLEVLQQKRVIGWGKKQEVKWVKRGKFYVRAAPTGADFLGHLCGGARTLAVEAKSVGPRQGRDRTLVLEEDFHGTQVAHLDAVARDGGLAILAVQFRLVNEPWVLAAIPWEKVAWVRAQTHHHLSGGSAAEWRIPIGSHLFEHLLAQK